MKAITICQPYAHLIVTGAKRVENRTWPSPFRGPLLIHAGKSREWMLPEAFMPSKAMAFGAVVGVAQMSACVNVSGPQGDLRLDHLPPHLAWMAEHEHASGPWCFVLENVRRFVTPVEYRGAQGLFDIPDDVVAAAIAQAVPVEVR